MRTTSVRFSRMLLALAIGTWPAGRPALAQQPLNAGFERAGVEGTGRPWGWMVSAYAPGADVGLDSGRVHSGHFSLRITVPPGDDPGATHALSEWISPRFAWGREVRFSIWVRADGTAPTATLNAQAVGNDAVIQQDSAVVTPGAGGWTRLSTRIAVDSSAHSVYVTVAARGGGTVWFDDLTVEVGGREVGPVPVGRAPSGAEMAWLAAHASPLLTVDATPSAAGSADLRALARIVGDARIVALGESTHGTSEFFRLKHRVTEYLVRELGFRVFAIEANQMAVEYINAYVHGAEDDVHRVVALMFAVWQTEEVVRMVEWMRAYNAAHPDRTVDFVGYDMQDPSHPIDSVLAFLGRHDPSLAPVADTRYRAYREAWRATAYPQAPDSVRKGWLDGAEAIWRRVAARRTAWLAAAGTRADSAEVEWAVQNANVVRQAAISAWTGDLPDRDSAMADNLRWILEQRPAGTRMVVWAHNGHVGRGAEPGRGFFLGRSMGVQLSRMYGDELRVFGLLTYDGQYRGTAGFTNRFIAAAAHPAPVGSVAEALHRIGRDQPGVGLIADLRAANDDPAGRWLHEPRPMRFVGYQAVDFGFEAVIAAADVFDAVLFVDHTTAAVGMR